MNKCKLCKGINYHNEGNVCSYCINKILLISFIICVFLIIGGLIAIAFGSVWAPVYIFISILFFCLSLSVFFLIVMGLVYGIFWTYHKFKEMVE